MQFSLYIQLLCKTAKINIEPVVNVSTLGFLGHYMELNLISEDTVFPKGAKLRSTCTDAKENCHVGMAVGSCGL